MKRIETNSGVIIAGRVGKQSAITNASVAAAVQTLYGYRGRPIETPYNINTGVYPKMEEINPQMLAAGHIRYIETEANWHDPNLAVPVTRLITLNAQTGWRGDMWAAFYVGALPKPDLNVTFNDGVLLRGFSVSQTTACAGDRRP